MSRGDRFFRRLLRLFPAEFRSDFGDDMTRTFEDQRDDVAARGGSMAQLRLWNDTVVGILTTAPREHWDLLRQDVLYGTAKPAAEPGVRRRRDHGARRRHRRQHGDLQHRERRPARAACRTASPIGSSRCSNRFGRAGRSSDSPHRTSRSCVAPRARSMASPRIATSAMSSRVWQIGARRRVAGHARALRRPGHHAGDRAHRSRAEDDATDARGRDTQRRVVAAGIRAGSQDPRPHDRARSSSRTSSSA